MEFANRKKELYKKLGNKMSEPYKFHSYQKSFFFDKSRFKLWLKSRQVGGTWLLSLEALLQVFLLGNPTIVITANMQLLDEFRDQFLHHLQSLIQIYSDLRPARGGDNRFAIKLPYLLKNNKLSSENVRCSFLLSNPRTARGLNGTVILDEFAFHQDPEGIFYSTIPMITRNYSYSFYITSTPDSKDDFFHQLYKRSKRKKELFSIHYTTIYDAIQDGLPIDINPIKNTMDPIEFRRAYLCEFMQKKDSLFTEEILDQVTIPMEESFKGTTYMGIDVGRKKDLSAISILDSFDSVVYVRKIYTFKNTSFQSQMDFIHYLMDHYSIFRCAIDSTGMGLPLAESLTSTYHSRIIPITIVWNQKENLLFQIRWALLNKKLFLPKNDPFLRSEFLAIHYKDSSIEGSIKGSHCDRFWATCYSYHAFLYSPKRPKSIFKKSYPSKKYLSWKKDSLFKTTFF